MVVKQVVDQKELGNLEIIIRVDQHNMRGELLDTCILLQIGDKIILRFKKLNEIKNMLEHNDIIKFDSDEEEKIFKNKVAAAIKKIQVEYELGENEDF